MNLFDMIGPVMIGPSSSHTAGACRIGYTSRALLGEDVAEAVIGLHGSFAKTYIGHGTDRAVTGGLLGMKEDDPSLRQSLKLAEQRGMRIRFEPVELRDAHPNTLTLDLKGKSGARIRVRAASVGGGAILVQSIDDMEVMFRGEMPTLVIRHRDMPGVIANVSGVLGRFGENIATMRVFRREAGGEAIMALEMDRVPVPGILGELRLQPDVYRVTLLGRL